jgi:thioredoxin reductase (NADPH)
MCEEGVLETDVGIVGAGPIGLELAAALKRAGVDYVQWEARQIGHTFTWWPRETYFFSTTERIEIAGVPIPNTAQQRTTGEEYLAYLRSVAEQLELPVRAYEPVVDIERREGRDGGGFCVHTRPRKGERAYVCRRLVLANGDMHGPNLLDIPGEDLPHVSHYFRDVHPYFRQQLLIVGGRNSAAEAALRCWRAGAHVTVSYRRAAFDADVVKHWILPDLQAQIEAGNIGFLPLTQPVAITPTHVMLERLRPDGTASGERFQQPADFVLLLTGYVGDVRLFERAGVTLAGPGRAPVYNPETMETDVPGLYVAGTVAAGQRQTRYTLFIENTHVHVGRIVQALTGQWPERLGTVAARRYDLPLEAIQDN